MPECCNTYLDAEYVAGRREIVTNERALIRSEGKWEHVEQRNDMKTPGELWSSEVT